MQFATGGAVNCMACAMNDTRLCVGGQSGTIAVYEVNMQSGSGDEQQGDEQPPKGADAGGGDESAPATAIFVRELLTFRCSGPVLSAAMPESGAFIVAGGESKVLELWSLASVHTPHHRHQGGGGGAYGGGNALVGDPGAISSAGGGEADVSAAAGGTIAAEALAAAAPSEAPSEASTLGMAPEAGLAAHLSTRFRCMTTIHSVALSAAGDTLAVGTSEETELYSVAFPGDGRDAYDCEPLSVLDCPAQQGGVAFDGGDRVVVAGQQLMLVTNQAKMIRLGLTSMRVIGRNSAGVRLFDVAKGEHVVGAARIDEDEEPENAAEEAVAEDIAAGDPKAVHLDDGTGPDTISETVDEDPDQN